MKKRLFKRLLYGVVLGTCVVLSRWVLDYIFNREPFVGGYFSDFVMGVSVITVIVLYSEYKKIIKERDEEKHIN